MLKKIDVSTRKRTEEIRNMKLYGRVTNAEASLDYLSMMSGIEMPEDESNTDQKGDDRK